MNNNIFDVMVAETEEDFMSESEKSIKWLATELGIDVPVVTNKEERYLSNDDETKALVTRKDALEYLLFRAQHDIYQPVYLNEKGGVTVVGVTTASKMQAPVKPDGIDIDDDDIYEAAASNGILIVHPQEDGMAVHPIMEIAMPDLCREAGISGWAVRATIPKKLKNGTIKRNVLTPTIRGQIFTDGLRLREIEKAHLLIRDKKIARIGSEVWKELDAAKGLKMLEEYLDANYIDNEYVGGDVSEVYLRLVYDTNEDMTDLEQKLSQKMDLTTPIKFQVAYVSGEVGESAIKVIPMLNINSVEIPLGKAISVPHVAGSDLDTIKDKLPKIGKMVQEAEDQIEELGNIDIDNVLGCFKHMTKETFSEINEGIVKAVIESKGAEYEGTAIDVYLLILDAVMAQANKDGNFNVTTYVKLSETATRFLFSKEYKKFDKDVDDED